MAEKRYNFEDGVSFVNLLREGFYKQVGLALTFFLVVFWWQHRGGLEAQEISFLPVLQVIVPVICIGLSLYAHFRYYQSMRQVRKTPTPLRLRLNQLMAANRKKFLWLLTANMIAHTVFLFTAHSFFSGVSLATFLLFAMSNPTLYSVMADLRLPKEEREIIKTNQPIPEM